MNISNYPAIRPKQGNLNAKTVKLETNMFKYVGKNVMLHYYDVRFNPDVNRKNIFDTFMRAYLERKSEFPDIAFDGINMLVASQKFPNKSLKLGKERVITIDISYKNSYDMNDFNKGVDMSQHIQCLEVICRYWQLLNAVSDRQKVFENKSDGELSSIIDLKIGLAHNIKLTSCGFYLNVDTAFAGFYKSIPLTQVIEAIFLENKRLNQRPDRRDGNNSRRRDEYVDLSREYFDENFWYNLEKLIKNVKVQTNHRSSKQQRELSFKISGILQQPASRVVFEMGDKKMSVEEYFAQTYGPLKYPHLPVVVIKKQGMELFFPIEVLNIKGDQKYVKKLDENQTSSLIKFAAMAPANRFKKIQEKLRSLPILKNKEAESFGIVFDGSFAQCNGKQLEAPKIVYGQGKVQNVMRGSWNLMNVKAFKPVNIQTCTIFAWREPRCNIGGCIQNLDNLAAKYGMKFIQPIQFELIKNVDDIVRAVKDKNIQLAIVVLKDKSSARYEEIKRKTETNTNSITQCLLEKNFMNLQKPPFVGNLLLKINSKLGGENSILSKSANILNKPTLVLGIDVNHPGIGDLNSPSIVAIVGSMNKNMTAYKTIIKQQERRQEVVMNLDKDIKTMLQSFYSVSRTKPEQIIVFRDGVGDTMFHEIFQREIIAIKDACEKMQKDYNPKITFIVAQKRHSIRFNDPQAPPDRNGNPNGNVQPGTIVEDIGHPTLFDFYLVSHHALQGTARPVRYLVLLNESNFSSEQIYEFVYGICHNYARATKAVSVVPPIYYAHLAAYRGKAYLLKDDRSDEIRMLTHNPNLDNKLFYV
ncbi:protein argonaute-2 [Vairimorpha apis BRL 01]|uniref:Protein argonaute-2 n=1 Tax=Vairimorpha apis BRL 01 TaxID=1037528 RepID=T0MD46_9MICR|nr:protein argonaute-2 [Vairimorpha apis BRL 01]